MENSSSRLGSTPLSVALFRAVLQQITGLAIQRFAQGIQRAEPHRLGFSGFQNGQVLLADTDHAGQLVGFHISSRQHDVEIYLNRHEVYTV